VVVVDGRLERWVGGWVGGVLFLLDLFFLFFFFGRGGVLEFVMVEFGELSVVLAVNILVFGEKT